MKAEELSPGGWEALLEPYGWAYVMAYAPAWLGNDATFTWYEIRVMLAPGADGGPDEWVQRSRLLDQARRAVEAVRAKGYIFMTAPRIEFGGEYRYRVETGAVPEWTAQATLEFCVRAT